MDPPGHPHSIDAHRTRNVLQFVRAQILEGKVEPVAYLVVNRVRDEDAARGRKRLEPRRNVDAVTVDPGLVVDDVTEVDADAEQHPAILGHILVARRHSGLDLDRTRGRADHAGKLGEDAVARRVDYAATVAAHQGQDHGLVGLEVADRGGLVLAHEPAVAGDVRGQKGGEPALDRLFSVHHMILAGISSGSRLSQPARSITPSPGPPGARGKAKTEVIECLCPLARSIRRAWRLAGRDPLS
jgi:hypothetical protein